MATAADRQHIVDEVNSLSNRKMFLLKALVICPFHNDKNPSGTVSLDDSESRVPLGWFRCWSCGTSVRWNDFAEQTGLRKLKIRRESPDDYAKPDRFKDVLIGQDVEDETIGWEDDYDNLRFKKWGDLTEWRSVKLKVLKQVGARLVYHKVREKKFLFIPVNVEGKLRGYVLAKLEKPTSFVIDGETITPPSYLNAPGKWSNEFGLIYLDTALEMARENGIESLVLCEGPRDAMRLLRYGIPAVSVLGALNWSEAKRMTLERSGIDNLILFMDGDDAGRKAAKGIYKDIKMHFNTKIIKTWKIEPGADPFSCSKALLRRVRDKLVLSGD